MVETGFHNNPPNCISNVKKTSLLIYFFCNIFIFSMFPEIVDNSVIMEIRDKHSLKKKIYIYKS